jgi:hypothetical protein
MKKTKFSEWVAERHPEFQQLDEWPWSNTADERLAKTVSRDRRERRANPAPRPISSEKNIQGIAKEFMAAINDAVKAQQADTQQILAASEKTATKYPYLSPRKANDLFTTCAFRSGPMGLQRVETILLSMTEGAASMKTDDPTLRGTRDLRRATVGQEITQKDRTRIYELMHGFLNNLVGPTSGTTATPAD